MSASTSTSEVSDRPRRFDKNATAEEVRAWILEYACKYGQNEVVKGMSAGDPKKLLQYGILEGRLVAYLLWNCVAENIVEGYDLCVQLLRHTYAHAPLVNFRHYARILYGLKVKVMLHILADKFELCLASSKLKELFPKEGEKLPPVLKLDSTLEKQLSQLNRQSAQFRQLVLDLILDREKREAYLQDEMEEEFGAEFSLTLHDLVAKFVQTVEDYLPAPVIEEISSSELYLSPPDGCSPAVSSLLTVLEVTNGNPSTANLTQLLHELDNVSTTGNRRRNCLPGRNEVKVHSGFKSPKMKEKKVELHRNSLMKLQFKERGSAIQESTSTESSDSQKTVCSEAIQIILSDSSDEEIVEVSSELLVRSDCSPRGKKATTLPRKTDTRSVTRVKTSLCSNKSLVGAETKGSETEDSATDVEVLNKVEEKARPLKSWNLWENTLRKDLVGSNSRGSKEFGSFLEDEQEMQLSTEDTTGDETQFSQGSSVEENQGDDSVHDDKTGAEKSIIRKEDDPRSDEDFASPLAITLDSSIDSDISSPLLFASLQEDFSWKKKRQREDEQLSTEHSRKRQKLDLQENISEKSSTNIQVPEAGMQRKTLNVEKIQLTYECHERKNIAEEVANQSSCSNELVDLTDDKANKSEDEDTCAEGASTSQVSIFPSVKRHSGEVIQETPMECTDSCSVVGSLGDTQPFSPDLQEATQHKDDSTTITQHADASTMSEPKDDNLICEVGTKSLTEDMRPSEDADRISLPNVSFRGSATSSNVKRQDFPLTPMESTLCASAEERIDASPHGKEREDNGSPVQWDKMVHCAIQSTPTGVASLADICQYITDNFPHHSSLDLVAQSVCRVLSIHKCFQVVSSPREIKWTLSSACGHTFLPGPPLVPTERGSSPVNSDVTSSTPDGIDSASKALTSNPSGDDRQTSISVMEEEEKNPLPDSESTCMTRQVDSNKTPESGADTSSCSDNTVSSSQDGTSTVQRTVSSSSSHTCDIILEETELEEEERDTMLTSPPYSENREQTHDKSRMMHTDSENSGTEKGSHSQSSDESIIPPSPQEGQRAKFVTFARTRRGLAVPHTCGKAEQEAGSMLAGGEDTIVSDSDSDSESTVLYYEENEEDSDAESYVIPNSHEQDDSFNSVTGPKAPVLGASTRSALWTKDNTLVPSLSQHLSPCPVRPCVVLLHRIRPDDLRLDLKKS